MFYGKIVAGLIGLLVGGVFGLIIGVFIGHSFDKALVHTLSFGSPENIARIQNSFFETTFMLLGHLAKADGRISEQEVAHTEQIIAQMGLDAQQRKRAIELFQSGAEKNFQLESTISTFNQTCGARKQLQQTLLLFLVSLAMADDHKIERSEHDVLSRIASLIGFNPAQLEQLLRMAQAQGHFHGGGAGQQVPTATLLEDAYAALGINQSASDKDLKRAYRKLMSENHPDKLIARGVPEDMIKIATEKSQEIQSAYEMVRKHRGIGK